MRSLKVQHLSSRTLQPFWPDNTNILMNHSCRVWKGSFHLFLKTFSEKESRAPAIHYDKVVFRDCMVGPLFWAIVNEWNVCVTMWAIDSWLKVKDTAALWRAYVFVCEQLWTQIVSSNVPFQKWPQLFGPRSSSWPPYVKRPHRSAASTTNGLHRCHFPGTIPAMCSCVSSLLCECSNMLHCCLETMKTFWGEK